MNEWHVISRLALTLLNIIITMSICDELCNEIHNITLHFEKSLFSLDSFTPISLNDLRKYIYFYLST